MLKKKSNRLVPFLNHNKVPVHDSNKKYKKKKKNQNLIISNAKTAHVNFQTIPTKPKAI